MSNFYEEYKELLKNYSSWFRFPKKRIHDEFSFETLLTPLNSNNFIRLMFFNENYINLVNKVKYPDDDSIDRGVHTVSAFFMGIMLKEKLKISVKAIPRVCGDYHKSFLFFWAMICLAHDITYRIEREKSIKEYKTLDDFVEKNKIQYNLLNETQYSQLFRNYYKYRYDAPVVGRKSRIDHGITCGIIIYDALMRRYYLDVKTKKEVPIFIAEDEWKFNKNFKKSAIKISETIARHNLWIADKKSKKYYEKYNLFELIEDDSSFAKVAYAEKDSLLFLLGLVDSLEPYKCCGKDNKTDIYDLLQNIEIKFNSKNKYFTMTSKQYIDKDVINGWKTISKWLELKTEEYGENGIKITFKYDRTDEKPKAA